MRREPFEFFRRCAREFGDVYRVPFPLGGSIVVVNHPDYASQVMDDPVGRYSMIGPGQAAMGVIGAAIPMLEGTSSGSAAECSCRCSDAVIWRGWQR